MGLCLRDPCFSWASRLLGIIGFLSVFGNSAKDSGGHGSRIQDSDSSILLKGIQGGSVWFHVNEQWSEDKQSNLIETSLSFASRSQYFLILRADRGTGDTPDLTKLHDMYKARVQVPSLTSMKIENLTPQDSGKYKVAGLLSGGKEFTQHFYLKVYEPVSPPKILVKALSITADWCNVTLECRATGATEDLNVTWERRAPPWELEQRRTLATGSDTWTQVVSLPLSQANANLSCVVSNPMDQNNATLDLSDICSRGVLRQSTASLIGGLLVGILTVLLLLGAALYLWKIHKKKKVVMKKGARFERNQNICDDDIMYTEVTDQKAQEDKDKGIDEQHLGEKGPLTTIYSEVGVLSKQPLKMI